MTVNQTSFAGLLKRHYSPDKVLNLAYKNRPFLGLVPKKKDWGGSSYDVPMIYGDPVAGRSQSISNASTNRSSAQVRNEVFVLTSAPNYSEVPIAGETIASSRANGGRDVFINAVQSSVQGAINGLANDLAFALFRDGSGARGQIKIGSTVTAATTITLEQAKDAHYFEVGMVIVAGSGSDGSNIKQVNSVDNSLSITGVDRQAGTLTFSAAVDSFSANDWAAADYLFVQGDPTAKISGLGDWLPTGTPAALFGVTRTTDRSRLAGLVVAAQGTIEETLIEAMSEVSLNGGEPTHCFMHHSDLAALTRELGSQVQRGDAGKAGLGYQSIMLYGPNGLVACVADRGCPKGRAYMLDMSTWLLASRGETMFIDMDDGQKFDRIDGSDAVVVRVKSYSQLGCRAPGYNATITLP